MSLSSHDSKSRHNKISRTPELRSFRGTLLFSTRARSVHTVGSLTVGANGQLAQLVVWELEAPLAGERPTQARGIIDPMMDIIGPTGQD